MSMSKKDYQAIARAIHMLRTFQGYDLVAKNEVIMRLADVLECDNPLFKRGLFEEACLTGKCKGMKGAKE